MFDINWDITIGKYKLTMLDSVEIVRSVEQLSDTATVVLPGSVFNKAIEVEQQIKRGDYVTIRMGYDNNLVTEFTGYLQSIPTDDGSITLKCEDALFRLRTAVNDKELINPDIKDILSYVLPNGFSFECDYSFKYDKFVIQSQTAYQVIKKLQEESKANIYLKGNVLHVHGQYSELFGVADYSFQHNIESSDLEYINAEDRKIDGVSDTQTLRNLANEQLKVKSYTGYSGSFTGWLIPYCDAGYKATISDSDYEYKSGSYYVTEVTTRLSKDGGVREIKLGRKL